MLLVAALLALSAAPSRPPAPVTYVTYVSVSEGRCYYATGDVFLAADQFEEDLRERFDRGPILSSFTIPISLVPASQRRWRSRAVSASGVCGTRSLRQISIWGLQDDLVCERP